MHVEVDMTNSFRIPKYFRSVKGNYTIGVGLAEPVLARETVEQRSRGIRSEETRNRVAVVLKLLRGEAAHMRTKTVPDELDVLQRNFAFSEQLFYVPIKPKKCFLHSAETIFDI